MSGENRERSGGRKDPGPPRTPHGLRLLGAAVGGTLSVASWVVAAVLVYLAYAAEPRGSWDAEAVNQSRYAAGSALGLAVLTLLGNALFVRVGWLRRWWYVVPVLIGVAAALRLTWCAPQA